MTRRPGLFLMILTAWLLAAIALSPALILPARAEADAIETPEAGPGDGETPKTLTAEDLKAEAAIVMDSGTGRVLFEKSADETLYPASTTKIMTALLALEYGRLDEMVKVPKSVAKLPSDSSLVPLKPGEKLSLLNLLYGLMLPSGNDAAVSIAGAVSGSVDEFVARMNERAQALGCENTHFENPHGYQNKGHYTTARDLALITREAMKNETFRQIISAQRYTLPATGKSKKRKLVSTNEMLSESSPYYYPYAVGVKTGHHSKAGYCFVGAAEKDGVTLITVVLKSTSKGVWADTRRLMEYGFSQYETYAFDALLDASPLYATVKNAAADDPDGARLRLAVEPGGTIHQYRVTCLPDDLQTAAEDVMRRISIEYAGALAAPIQEGDVLGSVSLAADDGSTLSGSLIASRDVAGAKPAARTVSAQSSGTAVPQSSGTAATQESGTAAAQESAQVSSPGSAQGQVAPREGAGSLGILWILLALLAGIALLILVLRIRRAVRRRNRARRRRGNAYARYREAR